MSAAPSLAIIAAIADNGVIGHQNKLPWRLSDDLRRFKRLTLGHTVLMGRRTFESMGRPLAERRNLVLSRQPDYTPDGAEVFEDLDRALRTVPADANVFVLGGSAVFALTLPLVTRMFLTRVHAQVEGDVFFPPYDPADWMLIASETHPADVRNDHPYAFEDYTRRTT